MSAWLWVAAGLSLFGAIGHVVDGERRLLPPYLRSGIMVDKSPAYTAGTLRLAWHVWSLAYLAFAVLFAVFAVQGLDDTSRFVVAVLAGLFAAIALLSVLVIRAFHPAQVLFGVLAGVAGAALL